MVYILDKLTPLHDLACFSSGVEVLDDWLVLHALDSEKRGTSTTYVWHCGDKKVVAYFALSICSINKDETSGRIARGSPQEIPSILLGKLALDHSLQGQDLGGELLYRALEMVVRFTTNIAARLVVVDALNERVAGFYKRYGFIPFMNSELRLARKISDIRKELIS